LTEAKRFASLVAMKPALRTSRLRAGAGTGASADTISSRENRWLKRFRAALHGAESGADAAIGVEGPHLVEAALGSGARVEAVLVSTSGERHLARLHSTNSCRRSDLAHHGSSFRWACRNRSAARHRRARACALQASFDDITRGCPLLVVLAGVQDPGNVGAILRTAEAMGATAAATCAVAGVGASNPLAPKALRASAGSALRLPLVRGASAATLMLQLRVAGIKSYAACPVASRDFGGDIAADERATPPALRPWEADWKGPVALWIGNEGAGLPGEIARSADARVTIPQMAAQPGVDAGKVESLNAAAAATILLYEAAKQRGTLTKT
jgi:TrmH family RNA methyltransferase